MIRTLSIDSVGLSIFQCMFECFQCFFDFHLLSNCIIWEYWSLVIHEFTLASVGSYAMGRYASERMAPVEQISYITVCRMSSLLLILSTFFDDNDGAGSTLKILSNCNCVLLKECWMWWLVLVAEDSVVDYSLGKSPSLGAAGFRQQDTQMDSPPFSICLRSFIPD